MEALSKQLEKQECISKLRSSTKAEIDTLLTYIIKEKIKQEKDPHKLYEFFTYIYDNLYHDIIFKKIHIHKPIIHALESLAMPVYSPSTIPDVLKRL